MSCRRSQKLSLNRPVTHHVVETPALRSSRTRWPDDAAVEPHSVNPLVFEDNDLLADKIRKCPLDGVLVGKVTTAWCAISCPSSRIASIIPGWRSVTCPGTKNVAGISRPRCRLRMCGMAVVTPYAASDTAAT